MSWLIVTALACFAGCNRQPGVSSTTPPRGASSVWSGGTSRSGPSTEQLRAMARAPFANDLGPSSIDVSAYPPAMQRDYRLFAQKCSKCHTLARPINSQYAARETWERYVKTMWRKPGSDISGPEAKRIWAFLTYDSQARKLSNPAAWRALRRRLLDALKARDPDRYRELYDGRASQAIEPQ